ncbi:hypothetical protein [Sphingomonas profundi]|uniref:hypothetical protein n=1 Tax=Alterirhizorhabdus profundi TaxID=2681549 RepID=UPI0012E83D3D|nr:hypothetical protein [Sphingomonas profundi]
MADKPIDPLGLLQALAAAWTAPAAAPPPPSASGDAPSARLMAQALAAANMPSRAEVDEIAARLDRIEETLARIERLVKAGRRAKPRKATKKE